MKIAGSAFRLDAWGRIEGCARVGCKMGEMAKNEAAAWKAKNERAPPKPQMTPSKKKSPRAEEEPRTGALG